MSGALGALSPFSNINFFNKISSGVVAFFNTKQTNTKYLYFKFERGPALDHSKFKEEVAHSDPLRFFNF